MIREEDQVSHSRLCMSSATVRRERCECDYVQLYKLYTGQDTMAWMRRGNSMPVTCVGGLDFACPPQTATHPVPMLLQTHEVRGPYMYSSIRGRSTQTVILVANNILRDSGLRVHYTHRDATIITRCLVRSFFSKLDY